MTPSPDTEPKPAMKHVDEDGYKDAPKTISPTENTEELDLYDVALDFLVEAIDNGEIEVGELRDGGRRDKSIANAATIRLAKLIAQSNHQAVQAFGEKVLKEAIGEDERRLENRTQADHMRFIRNQLRAKQRLTVTNLMEEKK